MTTWPDFGAIFGWCTVILEQDPTTGYWNKFRHEAIVNMLTLGTHLAHECEGRLCDVHNRRGTGPQATWPLNWRDDRGIMEVICPCGIGHPTPAQAEFFDSLYEYEEFEAELVHGCCIKHCPLKEYG